MAGAAGVACSDRAIRVRLDIWAVRPESPVVTVQQAAVRTDIVIVKARAHIEHFCTGRRGNRAVEAASNDVPAPNTTREFWCAK